MTSAVLSSLKKQYGSKLQKGGPNVMAKYNIDYLMTSERAIQQVENIENSSAQKVI